MRGFRSTLVLLFIFLGLLGYIYFFEVRKPTSAVLEDDKDKPKVFDIEPDKIEELSVRDSTGGVTALKKSGGTWQIVAPLATGADQTEVSGIASSLTSVRIQRVVEENATDVAPFGLAEPRLDVAFKASGDKDFRHLLIGDKTATGGDLYARLTSDKKVFLVPSYLDSTFNRTTFDLRDKTILKFDRDKVDAVEVMTGGDTLQFTRANNEWTITKPWPARGDYGTIEGLIGRVGSAQMKAIVTDSAAGLKDYGLDKPAASVTIGAGSARARVAIGKKAADTTVYAQDTSRGMVFTVESSLVDDLKKAAPEYRRKDVFEFRTFNAARFEVVRDGQTVAFEKTKGSEKDAQEKWRQVAPAARDVDTAQIETVLTKFANLRAQSFAEPKATRASQGLDKPAAVVTVRYDDGKKEERVTFGRAGSDVYAARPDDPTPAKLDAKEFDEALKELDGLKPTESGA